MAASSALTEQGLTQAQKFSQVTVELTRLMANIIEQLYNDGLTNINPQIIILAAGFIESFPAETILNTFIKYSTKPLDNGLNCWDQIHNRDELFFIENCQEIFSDLPLSDPSSHINAFKTMFVTKYILKEIRLITRSGDRDYDKAEPIRIDQNYRIFSGPHGHVALAEAEDNYDQGEPIVTNNLRYILKNAKFITPTIEEGKAVLSNEDKQELWSFFDAMVKISIKDIHLKREPTIKVNSEGQKEAKYSKPYLKEFKGLNKYAKDFGITLEWK